MSDYPDLLEVEGAVTAPAGCGKTHLVADAVAASSSKRPLLVLTHTNAGVAALRQRLARRGAATTRARVSTLDGWAMNMLGRFPARSGHAADLLDIGDPKNDYPELRKRLTTLLGDGHLNGVLQMAYSRVIVDEYQDCNLHQHAVVQHLANLLPTVVLGDPMQAIFDFAEPVVDWQSDVIGTFGEVAELDVPHRWINAKTPDLGQWLLDVRTDLLNGKGLDLVDSPDELSWHQVPREDVTARASAAKRILKGAEGQSLLIVNKKDKHAEYARLIPGASVVEDVELRALLAFCDEYDVESPDALPRLLTVLSSLTNGLNAAGLAKQAERIVGGSDQPTNGAESEAARFLANPTMAAALGVVRAIGKESGVKIHRKTIFDALVPALQHATLGVPLPDAGRKVREQLRARGRSVHPVAVGSTLLLKGLEAERSILLETWKMNTANLYVALTRGSKEAHVCSESTVLVP